MPQAGNDPSILEETETIASALPRPLGVVLVLAGIGHLLVPGVLLWLARLGYDRVLGVDFSPRETARRRVRIVGLGLIATGAHLLYYGGIVPES